MHSEKAAKRIHSLNRTITAGTLILAAVSISVATSGCSKEQQLKQREQKLSEFATSVAEHLLDRNPDTIQQSLVIFMHEQVDISIIPKLENAKVIPDSPITLMRETEQWKSEHRSNKVAVKAQPTTPVDKEKVTYKITGTDSTLVDGKEIEAKPVDFSLVCNLTTDMSGYPRVVEVIGFEKNSKTASTTSTGSSAASKKRHRR